MVPLHFYWDIQILWSCFYCVLNPDPRRSQDCVYHWQADRGESAHAPPCSYHYTPFQRVERREGACYWEKEGEEMMRGTGDERTWARGKPFSLTDSRNGGRSDPECKREGSECGHEEVLWRRHWFPCALLPNACRAPPLTNCCWPVCAGLSRAQKLTKRLRKKTAGEMKMIGLCLGVGYIGSSNYVTWDFLVISPDFKDKKLGLSQCYWKYGWGVFWLACCTCFMRGINTLCQTHTVV